MKPKVILILNKKVSEVSDSCPTATVDIEENSKNITLILNSIAAKSFALYAAEKGSAVKIKE